MSLFGPYAWCAAALASSCLAQSFTTGFPNTFRPEAPGSLLSHPDNNDSRGAGRTTNLMYHGGWLMTGSEAPGSQAGADMEFRVYDVSDPANPVRMHPSDFGLSYDHNGVAGIVAIIPAGTTRRRQPCNRIPCMCWKMAARFFWAILRPRNRKPGAGMVGSAGVARGKRRGGLPMIGSTTPTASGVL